MNIFLTGGTGFLGKNFLKLALKNNHRVTALTRKTKKLFKHKNLKWLIGSLEDNWIKELKKNEILVHFAAEGVINNNPIDIYDVNIYQSEKLFKDAIKANCKKWLIISSSSEVLNALAIIIGCKQVFSKVDQTPISLNFFKSIFFNELTHFLVLKILK